MEQALHNALNGPVSVLNRMRLACTTEGVDGKPLACDTMGMLISLRFPMSRNMRSVYADTSRRRRVAGDE